MVRSPLVILSHRIAMAFFLCLVPCLFILAHSIAVISIQEVGPNVVASGSGSIDLTGLAFGGTSFVGGRVDPAVARVVLSIPNSGGDYYFGSTGPATFGSSNVGQAGTTGSGDVFGVNAVGAGYIMVPTGYVSGSPLLGITTFNGATFSGLSVTPGTYVYTWGTDSLTVVIGSGVLGTE